MRCFSRLIAVFMIFMALGLTENPRRADSAQPTAYERQTDFTDHSENYPTTPIPGGDLDDEFNAVKTTLDGVLDNLQLIQRDDGAIANDSIGADQLKDEIDLSVNPAGDWTTATAYEENDAVWHDSALYRCLVDHTAGTFATDLAANKWSVILDLSPYVDGASDDADAAAASAAAAASSETSAAAYATQLYGTSTSSVAIGVGSKSFTTQSGKFFDAGTRVLISDNAAPTTNTMFGTVTSYSGTSLTVNVAATSGSGTLSDWTIRVSGERGATGATGAPGAGTGDMLAANNLSDVSDVPTSQVNLDLEPGVDVQVYDLNLDMLSSLTPAADKGIMFSSATAMTTYDLTSAGRALLDDASASAQRTTLGLGSAATLTAGTSASNVVQLDGSAKLPAVDGSQLTNLPAGGAWTLLEHQTASSSSTIDFDNFDETACAEVMIVWSNVDPSSDGAELMLRLDEDNGASYNSTGYVWSATDLGAVGAAATNTVVGTGSDDGFELCLDMDSSSNNGGCSGSVEIMDPSNATYTKTVFATSRYAKTSSEQWYRRSLFGKWNYTVAADAFRLFPSSGNFVSGEFYFYCLTNS